MSGPAGLTAGRLLAAVAGALALLLAAAGGAQLLQKSVEGPRGVAVDPSPEVTDPATEVPATPDPAPTEEPTATPTDQPTTPSEPFDDAIIAEITAQVAGVRGLEATDRVDAQVMDDDALADKIGELIAEEQDLEQLEVDRRILVALRLIPEDLDLEQLLDDLYREQVAGVYVPEDEVLYVGGGVRDPSPLQRSILAHEVTHALQDQHFDLAGFVDLPDEQADEQLARVALVEGDATLTQQLWAFEHLTAPQQGELLDEAFQIDTTVLDSAPEAIARSLSFPYVEGAQFAAALFQQGGMSALDDAFARPPATTEHILHPDRYQAGEEAVPVQTAQSAGEGWSEIERGGLGEFDLQLMFDLLGRAEAAEIAQGWGGGELAAWDRGGDLALAVSLAFDSPDDATEACRAIPRWYTEAADAASVGAGVLEGDRDWLAFTCSGDRVGFGLAPDEATARALVGG